MQHLNPPPKSQLELSRSNVLITPDSCSVIATSGCEEVARRARCDRDNRVLVSLEHHLSMSRVWIPELHAPIFGAAHHPFSARCQAHAKYVVLSSRLAKGNTNTTKVTNLVAFERPDTLSTIRRSRRKNASLRSQLPHLDSLVQTSTDQFATGWRKCHRIHAISMSVGSF